MPPPGILDAWDGARTSHAIALLLDERERRLPGGGDWSVAELKLEDADLEKLRTWAASRERESIVRHIERRETIPLPAPRYLETVRADAGYGLLLLALFSELVARHGSVACQWPHVYEGVGPCALREALFTATGVAKQPLKDAFAAAARRFDLRSTDLEAVGEQRWAKLLLLQGGVPVADAPAIGAWLDHAQGRTFLIDALHDTPSFRDAWSKLKELRTGTCTRDAAARALRRCPLLRAPAREIIASAQNRAAAPLQDPVEQAFDVDLRLLWPEGSLPSARLEATVARNDWGPRLELRVDGCRTAVYRRNNEGRYAAFGGGAPPRGLADGWEVALHSSDGLLASTRVTLTDCDDAIAAFADDGRPCPSGCLDRVRFLVVRDPVATTNAGRVVWLDDVGLGAVEVGPQSAVTTLDGAPLWPLATAPSSEPIFEAIRTEDVTAGPLHGALAVLLRHGAHVVVQGASIRSSRLAIASSAAGTTLLAGQIQPSAITPELRLRVTATRGGVAFQRTLPFRAFTAVSLDGAWLDGSEVVEAARLEGGALCLALGPELEGHDARLLALCRQTSLPVTMTQPPRVRVFGFGESLTLAAAPLWSQPLPHETVTPKRLAAQVVDHGAVTGHRVVGTELRLTHDLPHPPGDDHWVLVWPRASAPFRCMPRSSSDGTSDRIVAVSLPDGTAPRAVALCFGSAVLGASWADDWSANLGRASVDVKAVLRLVRVLRLPILAIPHRDNVVAWIAGARPEHALDLLATGTPDDWEFRVDGEKTLAPPTDGSRFAAVALALGLRLRLPTAALSAWRQAVAGRCPAQPRLTPGAAATDEHLRALQEWNAQYLGKFDAALAAASAVHPRDALLLVPCGAQRRYGANWAADVLREVRPNDIPLGDQAKLKRLRDSRDAELGRRAAKGLSSPPAHIVTRTDTWATSPGSPLDAGLETALVDAEMVSWVQLKLLHLNAE